MTMSFPIEYLQSPAGPSGAMAPRARRSFAGNALSRGCRSLLCPLLVCLALAPSLQSAPPAKTSRPAVANAPIAEPPLPRSEFDEKMPQGLDPFFPRSNRRAPVAQSVTPQKTAIVQSNFQLKGISGGVGRRLAIINDRTFGSHEDGEVTTSAGRIRIHCEEIRDTSVVIEVGNPPQRLELRLPKGLFE
jgi:hypothetical protein